MTVRSQWFVGVLVALALFVIIVASDSNEIKPSTDDAQTLKAFDVTLEGRELKLKRSVVKRFVNEKDTSNDLQINVKPSLNRFVLFRTRFEPKISNEIEARATARKGDEAVDRGIQRSREERIKRNASPSNETKSAEKARLDQIRVMHESWKSRECSANLNDDKPSRQTNVTRRYEVRTRRSKRNAITTNIKNDDYYAQKKAVMDKYHAREREIEAKYGSLATRLTSTPNRVQVIRFRNATNGNTVSYNVDNKKSAGNSVSKTTTPRSATSRRTKASQQVRRRMATKLRRGHRSNNGEPETSADENGDEYGSDDYYDSDEEAVNQTTDGTTDDKSNESSFNTVDQTTDQTFNNTIDIGNGPTSDPNAITATDIEGQPANGSGNGETLKWGNCTGGQMYQHNLNVSIHQSSSAYIDLLTMVEGSICITCFKVIPLIPKVLVFYEVRHGDDGGLKALKLHLQSSENLRLSTIVKIWAVQKYGDRC